jgi:hypothetical protein
MKPGYLRVTEILRPFSGIDAVPSDILAAANERGSRVHALCQGIIDGVIEGLSDVPDPYKGYVDSFLQWQEGKGFLQNPGRMYCDDHMITGECDGILKDERIFDLKTSQKESKTWKYQGAAYALLMKNYKDQVFVILDKSGGSPKEFTYRYNDHIDTFVKCVNLYRIFFKKRNPPELEYL